MSNSAPEKDPSFDAEAMDGMCSALGLGNDSAVRSRLQERLREACAHYRHLIATVPSDLPGAPMDVSLTERHKWADGFVLNPIDRLLEAIRPENRPLLSTWPEWVPTGRMPDFELLEQELRELQGLGRHVWVTARARAAAKASPGWEIKYEIVTKIAAILSELAPKLKPSRGTYDKISGTYVGRFPDAIRLAFAEITGMKDERLDRQIAEYVQGLNVAE